MNALTTEWVLKAGGDYATTGREMRARRQPNYDAACFHAQQTAEKYLKAFLLEHQVNLIVSSKSKVEHVIEQVATTR